MTKIEIENTLKNLQESVSALAGKSHENESKNASDISSVSSTVDSKCSNANVSSIWNASQTYIVDTFVIYENQLYKCLVDNYGVTPGTDSTHWELTNIVDELNNIMNILKGATA